MITLALDNERGWTATFSGPIAAEIVKAFGTNCIACGFTASMPAHEALLEIQALNPDETVVLGHPATTATRAGAL
jgi:hypothetical protein